MITRTSPLNCAVPSAAVAGLPGHAGTDASVHVVLPGLVRYTSARPSQNSFSRTLPASLPGVFAANSAHVITRASPLASCAYRNSLNPTYPRITPAISSTMDGRHMVNLRTRMHARAHGTNRPDARCSPFPSAFVGLWSLWLKREKMGILGRVTHNRTSHGPGENRSTPRAS